MRNDNIFTNNKGRISTLEKTVLSYIHTLDNMIEGIAILNFEWKFLYANEANARLTLLNRDDIIGRTIFEVIPGIESTVLFKFYQNVMNERTSQQFETDYTFTSGSMHWFQVKAAPVPEGIFIQSLDITEKKLAEKRELELLSLAEYRAAALNAIIESIPDAVFVGNFEGISLCNTKALKILGVDSLEDLNERIDVLAKKFNIRRPDTGIPFKEEELQIVRSLNGETVEEEVLATNLQTGRDVIIRATSAPVILNGNVIAAVVVESDITEKKQVEQIIKASLKEKEVLLRELHHRTKNNMQLISSLLSLKVSSLKDIEMISILNDMINRIKTIAKIHDMLHESKDLTQIDLSDYITNIINLLIKSFFEKTERISVKMELEKIYVYIDTAISCGLIVNELITNSLKYAFPGDRKGEILVKLSKPDDIIELRISDNGIGFKETESNEGSLGLQIFHLIAENQLEAETNLQIKDGVTVNLRFKDNKFEKEIKQ